MRTVDFTTRSTFERRIGRRVTVTPVPMRWKVDRGRRGLLRRRRRIEVAGRIEEVSLTGAGIVGPSDLDLVPGEEVVVRSRGRDNVVVVRHRRALDDRTDLYGVELTRWAAGLQAIAEQLVTPLTPRPAPGEPARLDGDRHVGPPAEPDAPVGHAERAGGSGAATDRASAPSGPPDAATALPAVAVAVAATTAPPAPPALGPVPDARGLRRPSAGHQVLRDVFGLMAD